MANDLVLLHGGTLGSWCWERLRHELEAATAVKSARSGHADLPCATWIRQVTELVPSTGLVLEAYGAGDVPPEIFPAVETYIARGGQVVVTSHGHPGRIEPTYPDILGTSHEMLSAGCYGSGVLTSRPGSDEIGCRARL